MRKPAGAAGGLSWVYRLSVGLNSRSGEPV